MRKSSASASLLLFDPNLVNLAEQGIMLHPYVEPIPVDEVAADRHSARAVPSAEGVLADAEALCRIANGRQQREPRRGRAD